MKSENNLQKMKSNSDITYKYYSDESCKNKIQEIINTGNYSVKATSVGNSDYASNSKCSKLTVNRGNPIISLEPKETNYNGKNVSAYMQSNGNINVYVNRYCNVYKYVLQKNTSTGQYELSGLANTFQGITGYEEIYDNKAIGYVYNEHKILTNQEF